MEANYYVYHPTDGTSVDLYIEWDDLYSEDRWPKYYKIITIWDEDGNYEIDPSIYDLSWMTREYIQNNYNK